MQTIDPISLDVFERIEKELSSVPQITNSMRLLLNHLVDKLCLFVPSRDDIHVQIKNDISTDMDLTLENALILINNLTFWIKRLHAPVYDCYVDKMTTDIHEESNSLVKGMCTFLRKYYDHVNICYEETLEARKKISRGENPVPIEHRGTTQQENPDNEENGIPRTIRSGR